jgi:ribonuclease P protein component
MIARDLRLRRNSDFDRVRAHGRSWSSRQVVLSVLANDTGQNRYGFAVGKRVGDAVARNRAKRVMREVARALDPRLRQGHDIVFIARNSFREDLTMQDVAQQVEKLVGQAGLWKEDACDASQCS